MAAGWQAGWTATGTPLQTALGRLEREVMDVVWTNQRPHRSATCRRGCLAGRLHHGDDDAGPAVQEGAGRATPRRARVRLHGGAVARGDVGDASPAACCEACCRRARSGAARFSRISSTRSATTTPDCSTSSNAWFARSRRRLERIVLEAGGLDRPPHPRLVRRDQRRRFPCRLGGSEASVPTRGAGGAGTASAALVRNPDASRRGGVVRRLRVVPSRPSRLRVQRGKRVLRPDAVGAGAGVGCLNRGDARARGPCLPRGPAAAIPVDGAWHVRDDADRARHKDARRIARRHPARDHRGRHDRPGRAHDRRAGTRRCARIGAQGRLGQPEALRDVRVAGFLRPHGNGQAARADSGTPRSSARRTHTPWGAMPRGPPPWRRRW